MRGESEVVVRAEINYIQPVGVYVCSLRSCNDPLLLIETGFFDFLQFLFEDGTECIVHGKRIVGQKYNVRSNAGSVLGHFCL